MIDDEKIIELFFERSEQAMSYLIKLYLVQTVSGSRIQTEPSLSEEMENFLNLKA